MSRNYPIVAHARAGRLSVPGIPFPGNVRKTELPLSPERTSLSRLIPSLPSHIRLIPVSLHLLGA